MLRIDSEAVLSMGWDDYDFFDYERHTFESQIYEVVLPLFRAAEEKLVEWEKNINREFDAAISRASDENQRIDAEGLAAYKATTVGDQRQVIGAACLSFVCSALKDCLDEMGSYFKKSHPPSPKGYVGKSWLQKRQQEYIGRFGIEFTKGPVDFSRIEELVLARNAGLHWDGSCLDEYMEKIQEPRFVKTKVFTAKLDKLTESFEDANKFIYWVWSELKKFRAKTPQK